MKTQARFPPSRLVLRASALPLLFAAAALAQPPIQSPNDDSGYFTSGNYFAVLGWNRYPDPGGWIYWHTLLAQGLARTDMTNDFLGSQEYLLNYGSPDAPTFVTLLYQNALGRTPSQGEINNYANQINGHLQTRAQVVNTFIYSQEFEGNTRGQYSGSYHTDWANPIVPATPYGTVPAGTQQTITVNYSNRYGAPDIFSGQIIISANEGVLTGESSCYVGWYSSGALVLSGPPSGYLNGTAGLGTSLAMNYCTLNTFATRIVPTFDQNGIGNGISVALSLTFPASFAGTHTVYSFATNTESLSSLWMNLGDLTVTSSQPTTREYIRFGGRTTAIENH